MAWVRVFIIPFAIISDAGNVLYVDPSSSNFVSVVMMLDLNRFGASVEDWVVGKGDGPLVVSFQ